MYGNAAPVKSNAESEEMAGVSLIKTPEDRTLKIYRYFFEIRLFVPRLEEDFGAQNFCEFSLTHRGILQPSIFEWTE